MKSLKILAVFALLFLKSSVYAQNFEQKATPCSFISALENNPQGILLGELDSRMWLHPNNSVYISKDEGVTWKTLGLLERGVTDIYWYDDTLYATTFYVKDGTDGLFIKTGETEWIHKGPVFSANHVTRDSQTIYLAGISHGLWISNDNGETWTQKIGYGWYGPQITSMQSSEDLTVATDLENVYVTTDHGNTWINTEDLRNKGISKVSSLKGKLIASAAGIKGAYVSQDQGNTWMPIENIKDIVIAAVIANQNNMLIYGKRPESTFYSIYYSADLVSWDEVPTDLQEDVKNMSYTRTDKDTVWLVTNNNSFISVTLPKVSEIGLFDRLWEGSPMIDRVTSYFDHAYPLAFYTNHQEPSNELGTTLNFYGEKGSIPDIYYSGHNGVDFALPYGTDIKAPYSGIARYVFCTDCGHTISIVHPNGTETQYMHLQREGLIVKPGSPQIGIQAGVTLGKVGMSGNTTGPHLHFTLIRSAAGVPDGYSDPFGWQSVNVSDPWPKYEWVDITGAHKGIESKYMWKEQIASGTHYFKGEEGETFSVGSMSIGATASTQERLTISATAAGQPQITDPVTKLKYIEGTSFVLKAWDRTGKDINAFASPIIIQYDLAKLVIENAIRASLRIFVYDQVLQAWIPLATNIDDVTNKIQASTDHLSHFVLMAETETTELPDASIIVLGNKVTQNIYLPPVYVSLHNSNTDGYAYFSLNRGLDWDLYTAPFEFSEPGNYEVMMRTLNAEGDIETSQTQRVNFSIIKTSKKVRISNAIINTSANYASP